MQPAESLTMLHLKNKTIHVIQKQTSNYHKQFQIDDSNRTFMASQIKEKYFAVRNVFHNC